MTAFDINNFPQVFRSYIELIQTAHVFDSITDLTHPDQTLRIALKETLIERMAGLVMDNAIPLIFIQYATDNGLRAAFLRVVGEQGRPADFLSFMENIAAQTGPTDWNMKWQIIRSYIAMHLRLPNDPSIVASAVSILPAVSANADAALTVGIANMVKILGIS